MIQNLVLSIIKDLNKKKINYAVLRNYENLPKKPRKTKYFDLDIIVEHKDLSRFDNLIKKAVSQKKSFISKSYKRSYANHYRIVYFSKFKFDVIQIDVHHKGQGFWGFYYIVDEFILKNKKKFKNFFVVSTFHENLFNWLDKLLWGNYVKNKYKKKIANAMKLNSGELIKFLKNLKISLKKKFFICSNLSHHQKIEKTLYYRKYLIFKIIIWSLINYPIRTINWTIDFFYKEINLRIFPYGFFVISNKKNKEYFNKIHELIFKGAELKIFNKKYNNNFFLYIYDYFKHYWPVLRKGGIVFLISDLENINKKKTISIYKPKKNQIFLYKKISSIYKKNNLIFFPNLFLEFNKKN